MGTMMSRLEMCFDNAIYLEMKYVIIIVRMEGFVEDEIIINRRKNFYAKLEYYQNAYDDNLIHKHSRGVSIVGFSFANSFEEIGEMIN